jgi:hypothetical protein
MAIGKKIRIGIHVTAPPSTPFKMAVATDETTPLVRPPLRPNAVGFAIAP